MSHARRFDGYPDPRRIRLARSAAVLACLGGAVYLGWRSTQLDEVSPLGWILFAAEVLNWLTLVSAVPLMWSPRPRRWAPPATGTLDVFVTVCGEDVAMVEETVQAALAIDYPHNTYVCNDGRFARRDNWQAIERMADRLGVPCFTRTDGYKGKAGNLNHAYARTDGDFIAIIDADHLARPELGDDLLGHFHPRVALVTTRQSFHIDEQDTLGNQEAFFYGVIQPAKDADNAAFSCGNGVVYRRAALADIGGFSEWNLVEDLRTSYELHARGWHSVYVPRPVTRGTAPGTAAEMASQRLRWATDSLRLFFWDNPLRKEGLTWRQRLHYAQTTGVYYLTTASHVIFLLSPVASLVFGVTVMAPSSPEAYAITLGLFLVPLAVMLVAFAGPRGAIRLAQMQTFLAPVFCVAAWRALRMRPGKGEREGSGVTEKGRQSKLNGITVFQHATFALLLVAIGVGFASPDGPRWAALLWASLMAAVLATQNSMVSLRRETAQTVRIALTAPAIVAGAVVVLAAWAPVPGGAPATLASSATTEVAGLQPVARRSAGAGRAPVAQARPQKLVAPRRGAYLGAYNIDFADPSRRAAAARRYGPDLRILHRFQSWFGAGRLLDRGWLDAVDRRGAVPMITWEPWRKPKGADTAPSQRPGLLRKIARGEYDPYIRVWAREAAEFRRPLMIRLMHEMNGSWYPWRVAGNGNTPEDYKAAWRHIHGVFDDAGATNVSWVFSIDSLAGGPPTPRSTLDRYYPGRAYVDWVGMSGFNWGSDGAFPAWRSFAGTFRPSYDVLKGFGKPVMVSEVGTSSRGGDPVSWISDALAALDDLPDLKAVVLFDSDSQSADFRLGKAAVRSLRRGAAAHDLDPPLRVRRAPEQVGSLVSP